MSDLQERVLNHRCGTCTTPSLCLSACRIEKQADEAFRAAREGVRDDGYLPLQPPVTNVAPALGKQWHTRRGWICPVCEKGVHPDEKVCPCK